MILLLMEMAESLGIRPLVAPIVLVLLLTGVALATPLMAPLFEDGNL